MIAQSASPVPTDGANRRGLISSMPIVMDLGFGEDGDAGDRGTVNRQATRGHEIYPGSGPRRENPTPACLLLITEEPKITGCADSIWHGGVCESMSRDF